jgi:hypothetical protein
MHAHPYTQHHYAAQREDGGRQLQVEQTTSSYDAAILNSAYSGGR